MSRNALDTFDALEAVAIRQEHQSLEDMCICFEQRNKYKISVIPTGQENRTFTDEELVEMPMIFDVREDSTICCRLCCHSNRELKLGLFPPGTAQNPTWPDTEPLLTLERPFKCICWCCCRLCCPQEMSISAEGHHLGRVEQDGRCIDFCCCCIRWMKSYNENGHPVHSFRSPSCGKNCFAPSFCNHIFEIDVFDTWNEKQQLGMLRIVWPGWDCTKFCSPRPSNFVVAFPRNTTEEEKALIIGSLFLHEFLIFEQKGTSQSD